MVANVNLPAAQLMIAMGIPLHRIKAIRFDKRIFFEHVVGMSFWLQTYFFSSTNRYYFDVQKTKVIVKKNSFPHSDHLF